MTEGRSLGDIFEDMDKAANTFFGKFLPEKKGEQMTEKQYNLIPAVRRSDLILLRRSPKHLEYAKSLGGMQEPTPAQIFGAAMHKAILEPDTFDQEYAIAPLVDKRTKAGKEEWQAFMEENAGRTVLSIEDAEQIEQMKKALHEHPNADALLSGEHETTHVWTDTETGELCKVRLDCLTFFEGRPTIVDYKTVASCEDRIFERDCRQYGYKIQAGMYTEGLAISSGFTIDAGFVFVCQEKKAPFAVRVYRCDPGFVEQGNRQFHELLRYYHQCRETGEWPGYADGYLMRDEWEDPEEEEA